jgi:sporulation protein YlmC with PRC-barrel domain
MARNASIGTMIAVTALVAWPVLAQTTSGPGSAPPSPRTTTMRPAGSGMAPSGASASSTASSTKYFTAEHRVRAAKVVGASVYNDQNQSIGSIDDILMSDQDHKATTAVISVGGFLGMGSKLVSVPFDQLKIENDRIVMPGATKTSLQGMPEYRYTSA